MNKLQPWQCEFVRCSNKQLAIFMKALLAVGGHFTSSMVFPGSLKKIDGFCSAAFMVQIPVDEEKRFEELSGQELMPTSRLQVGHNRTPPYPYQGSFINERFPEYMKVN